MDQSYKARKEAFVSNLAGGDILEINAVTLVAPVCGSVQSFHIFSSVLFLTFLVD